MLHTIPLKKVSNRKFVYLMLGTVGKYSLEGNPAEIIF